MNFDGAASVQRFSGGFLTTSPVALEQSSTLIEDNFLSIGGEPLKFWIPEQIHVDAAMGFIWGITSTGTDPDVRIIEAAQLDTSTEIVDDDAPQMSIQRGLTFQEYLESEAEVYNTLIARRDAAREAEAAYWWGIDEETE